MTYHLVYRSHASPSFKEQEIPKLLEKSRVNNSAEELSGILIYRNRAFVQLLEGSQDAVLLRYNKIRSDVRHERVLTLVAAESEQRIFGDWSMAYVDPQTGKTSPDELFYFFDLAIQENRTDKSLILPMLKKFLGVLGSTS